MLAVLGRRGPRACCSVGEFAPGPDPLELPQPALVVEAVEGRRGLAVGAIDMLGRRCDRRDALPLLLHPHDDPLHELLEAYAAAVVRIQLLEQLGRTLAAEPEPEYPLPVDKLLPRQPAVVVPVHLVELAPEFCVDHPRREERAELAPRQQPGRIFVRVLKTRNLLSVDNEREKRTIPVDKMR